MALKKLRISRFEILAFAQQRLVVASAVTAEVPPDVAGVVVELLRAGEGRLAAVLHLEDLFALEVLSPPARDAQKQGQVLAEEGLGDLLQSLFLALGQFVENLHGGEMRHVFILRPHGVREHPDAFLGVSLLHDIEIDEIGVGTHVEKIALQSIEVIKKQVPGFLHVPGISEYLPNSRLRHPELLRQFFLRPVQPVLHSFSRRFVDLLFIRKGGPGLDLFRPRV